MSKFGLRCSLAVIAMSMIGGSALAMTVSVPTDYPTIHDAMLVVEAGDSVSVEPGNYNDWAFGGPFGAVVALGFLAQGVTLVAAAGPDVTTLDLSAGTGGLVTGLYVDTGAGTSGETAIVGFTITGAPLSGARAILARGLGVLRVESCRLVVADGGQQTDVIRGTIDAADLDLRIRDCLFDGCESEFGGALSQVGGTVEITSSEFRDCRNSAIAVSGGAILSGFESLFVENVGTNGAGAIRGLAPGLVDRCTFRQNVGTGSGGAVRMGGSATVRRSLFEDNAVSGSGAAIFAAGFGNTIEQNTIVRSTGTSDGAAVVIAASNLSGFRNNIVAHSSGGAAVRQFSANVNASCNVFYANVDGDASGYTLRETDRVIDPQFCDPVGGDWTLRSGSPCLPDDPLGCGLIGALEQGCGTVSIDSRSWGSIKDAFREETRP